MLCKFMLGALILVQIEINTTATVKKTLQIECVQILITV